MKILRSLTKDKSGAMIATNVVSAVIVVLILAIGAIVTFSFLANVDRTGFSQEANDTLDNLETQTESAWSIGNLLPLIIFAVAAIGAVVGILGFVALRGR